MIQLQVFQNVSSDFIQTINLDGQIVTLRMTYNIRSGFFFLTFTDSKENPLNGIKMVPNWLLLDQRKALIDFDGDLMILKVNLEAEDVITYDNLGTDWLLYYLTPDEVADWKTENGF